MLNYIGSKKTLLEFLNDKISNVINENTSFADLFSGTGVVGQHFKNTAHHVVVNDAEYYSFVVNYAMLKCDFSDKLSSLIQELNALEGISGLMTQHFSQERMFFTEENAKKIDAIRNKIEDWKIAEEIDNAEFFYLLACLLVAADKVANTASVYGAYLKQYKGTALKPLTLNPIHKDTTNTSKDHEVHNRNTLELILEHKFDVVYIDPPYNHRQYAANYSPLNYLALYDDTIEIQGKGGVIKNYFKSPFCRKAEVMNSFDSLIKNTKASYIFVSYNNEGLLPPDDMLAIFNKYGTTTIHTKEYKKYLSHKETKHKEVKIVTEYLYEIRKNN